MSAFEFIFIKTELTPQSAAASIAQALDMDVVYKNRKPYMRALNFDETGGSVGGSITENVYDTSLDDEVDSAPYDGYSLVWEIKHTLAGEDIQMAVARELFRRLTRTIRWPCMLIHNLDLILLSWDPVEGSREFPLNTSIDPIDRHIWG